MFKRIFFHIFIIIFLVFTPFNSFSAAFSITLTGSWSLTLTAAELSGGAGTDFVTPQESVADVVGVRMRAISTWSVTIRKVDTLWPGVVKLWVRKSSAGGGGGTTGGDTYQEVTGSDLPFFSGFGNVNSIGVQYKVEGLTVSIGRNTYITTVYYTATGS